MALTSKSAVNQHKRMAMGDSVKQYARGGIVIGGKVASPVGGGAMVPKPAGGKALSPMTVAKRNNGIPGMKKGGKC